MTPKLSQGITTVVTGNCGLSVAPYVVDEPLGALTLLGRSFKYPSVAAYARAVQLARPALNVAPLVGHTTLRFACMDDLSRPASAQQLQAMCALLERCMAEGAIGLSSGLFYAEAMPAPAAEVTALACVVARHHGVYTTHMRSEMADILDAMHEASDTAFAAGVPLIISHHKCAGPANWGRTQETLPLIDRLAAAPGHRDGRVPVRGRLHRAARGSGRRHHRRAGELVGAAPGDDGPPARRDRAGVGRDATRGVHAPEARRRLLLPDARGRRAARARAPAQHDRLRRPAARQAPASALVGRVPARARPLCARTSSSSRWSRPCTR